MLEVYFFNVGQGDSIAVHFPNDEWGIIDCYRTLDNAEPNVLRFLKKNKVKKINFLCITHPHSDHFNGCELIIEEYKDIETLMLYDTSSMNKIGKSSSLGKAVKKFIKIHKTYDKTLEKIVNPRRGDITSFGKAKICFLNPTDRIINILALKEMSLSSVEFNSASIVCLIEYMNIKVLLTADSTIENWTEILSDNNYKNKCLSDVIKISHHGSKANNPDYLLQEIVKKKAYAIISVAKDGRYSTLPSTTVIESLRQNFKADINLTYELSHKKLQKTINPYSSSIEECVSNALGENGKEDCVDGYIKIIIDSNGKIMKEIYPYI